MIIYCCSYKTYISDLEPHLAFPLDQLTHLTLMAHLAFQALTTRTSNR